MSTAAPFQSQAAKSQLPTRLNWKRTGLPIKYSQARRIPPSAGRHCASSASQGNRMTKPVRCPPA